MTSRSLLRVALALFTVALACAAVVFVLVHRALEEDAREGAERKLAAFQRHHTAFLDDRAYLASHPAFTGIGREADAGAFLNERVRWSLPAVDAPSPDSAPLALPEDVASWLGASFLAEMQATGARDEDLSDVRAPPPSTLRDSDPGWMKELHRYDHWDIGASPHHDAIDGYDLFSGPSPYYLDLVGWAKLRALRALSDGDVLAAHRDIAQLARLCLSTETVLGGMIAVAILSTDRALYERAQATADSEGLDGWTPFSSEDAARAQRALFATLQYFGPFTPDAYWRGAGVENVLDCVGVQEGLAGMHLLRPVLEPELPGRYAEATPVLAAARDVCNFSRLHRAWGGEASVPPDAGCDAELPTSPFVDHCIKLRLARYVPGLRGVAARALQGGPADPTSGFGRYEAAR